MVDPTELRDVFDRAASLAAADRAAFLADACGDKPALLREVERLLAADVRFGAVFDWASADRSPGAEPPTGPLMSLWPGQRLGPYIIVDVLGAGGMGEVYKARDSRLDRTVALKVLSSDLTNDTVANQRFEREARAAAALAHPHICTLLDIGRQDGVEYLVMEYIDGETLAARLQRETLPLEEALTYATHIAEALAAAHRAGIVHRDLKPGNVMLTNGAAKLLDFGLAKRRQAPLAHETTNRPSEPLTGTGVILGTVQYMAPEQLQGQKVDERTDIFAFGAVLYEMLTGRRAFEGESNATVIGKILHEEPAAPSRFAPVTPQVLDELVRVCLAKDPQARWQTMTAVLPRLATARDIRRRVVWPSIGIHPRWLVASAIAMAAAGFAWWELGRALPTSEGGATPVHRELTRLTFDDGLQTDPTFSPDGRYLAYASDRAGNFDIWVRQISGGDPVQITKSLAHDTQPSWSPDGDTIVFRSQREGGGLYVVPTLGGPESLVVNTGAHPSWSPDGSEIRFQTDPARSVGTGIELKAVTLSDKKTRTILPAFTATGRWAWIAPHPDGRFSFVGSEKATNRFGFFTVSAAGAVTASNIDHVPYPLTDLANGGPHRFQWNNDGTALLLETRSRNGVLNLWRVHVQPDTLDWTSANRLTTGAGSDVAAVLSPDGKTIAFSTVRESDRLWQFPLDAAGHLQGGRPLTQEGALAVGLDVAGNGSGVVYNLLRPGLEKVELWYMDLATGKAQFFASDAINPRWSPDHRRVAYTRARIETLDERTGVSTTGVAIREVGGPERLISAWSPKEWLSVTDWVPDGSAVLVHAGLELVTWPADGPVGNAPSRVVLRSKDAAIHEARFSPNGRWISFTAKRIAPPEEVQLGVASADGATDRGWTTAARGFDHIYEPRWAPDGKRLYFVAKNPNTFVNLWAVDFDPAEGRPIGAPFALTHFDSDRFAISPMLSFPGMTILKGQVFMSMHSATGNIWVLSNADR